MSYPVADRPLLDDEGNVFVPLTRYNPPVLFDSGGLQPALQSEAPPTPEPVAPVVPDLTQPSISNTVSISPELLKTIQAGQAHLGTQNATPVEAPIVIPSVVPEQFIFSNEQSSVYTAPVTINQQGKDEILYHISQVSKISPENNIVVDVIHEAVNESVTKAEILEVTKTIADTPNLNVNPVTLIQVFKEDAPAVAEAIKDGTPLSDPVAAAIIENNIVTEPGRQPIAPEIITPPDYTVKDVNRGADEKLYPEMPQPETDLAIKEGLLDRLTNYIYRLLFNKK